MAGLFIQTNLSKAPTYSTPLRNSNSWGLSLIEHDIHMFQENIAQDILRVLPPALNGTIRHTVSCVRESEIFARNSEQPIADAKG